MPYCRIISESWVELVLGDTIEPDTHALVMQWRDLIRANPFHGLLDVVPTYTTVSVYFDPLYAPARWVKQHLEALQPPPPSIGPTESPSALVQIPVQYRGADLSATADLLQMSENELITLHSAPIYTVYMIGFLPGFPYMGILPEKLQLTRLSVPRTRVPAGSVAIAGVQTGIYPQASPGGWRLLGHTDFVLFDPQRQTPATLAAGMKVKFVRV